MSLRLMSMVWDVELPDSDKLVLLALADNANDEGACWPSIATIAKKCSKGERTVQRAISALCEAGHLHREDKPGRGTIWHVHPRHGDTPATMTPVSPATVTPVTVTPKPTRTTTISSQASPSKRLRAQNPDPFPRPDFAAPQHWADFLANRKRKRLPNTATAHARMLADIHRFADDEWPPGRIIEFAAGKGWGGIYNPRGDGNGHRNGGRQSTGKVDGFGDALRSIIDRQTGEPYPH